MILRFESLTSISPVFGVFFVRELNERLSKSSPFSIIINATDPGRCETQLARNLPDAVKQQILAMNLSRYTTEEGSRALVYGAVGEAGMQNKEEDLKGAHIRRTRKIQYGDFVTGEIGQDLQKRLWVSTSLIKGHFRTYIYSYS
jgi:retinol dehydrogenase 12